MTEESPKVYEVVTPGPQGPAWIIWRGAYDPSLAYALNDGVTFLGSSFRAVADVAIGDAPVVLNGVAQNSATWEIVASGSDGVAYVTQQLIVTTLLG